MSDTIYNKHLLSLKYGIDETLPDELFYLKIQEINILVDEMNNSPLFKAEQGENTKKGIKYYETLETLCSP